MQTENECGNGRNDWAYAAYVFDLLAPGESYCFGDAGSGIPCPCNNDNDGSVPGSGCDNGVFASGAHLLAYGEASVSADTCQSSGRNPGARK